jgi:hypothetical protein
MAKAKLGVTCCRYQNMAGNTINKSFKAKVTCPATFIKGGQVYTLVGAAQANTCEECHPKKMNP